VNLKDKPVSDTISSVKQADVPEREVKNGELTNDSRMVEKKRRKVFPIIVGILLLLLILGVGVYFVYINYLASEDVVDDSQQEQADDMMDIEETQENTNRLGDIEARLIGQDKVLLMTIPNSGCDDTGFVETAQGTSEILEFEDNQNSYCSSAYKVNFFLNEEVMTRVYSFAETEYPLEKINVDGVDYEYILKEDYSSESGIASATVYIKEPTREVGGYEAFQILWTYKVFPEGTDSSSITDAEILEDGTSTTYCVFDLSKIDSTTEGYLVFSGGASAGSEIDYCEILDNTQNFEIKIL